MKNWILAIVAVSGVFAAGCASNQTRQLSSNGEIPTLDCKLPDSTVSFRTYPPQWYAAADITFDAGARLRNQYLEPTSRSGDAGVLLRDIRELRTAAYRHNQGVRCVVTILANEIPPRGSVPAKFVCGNRQFDVTCQHTP